MDILIALEVFDLVVRRGGYEPSKLYIQNMFFNKFSSNS